MAADLASTQDNLAELGELGSDTQKGPCELPLEDTKSRAELSPAAAPYAVVPAPIQGRREGTEGALPQSRQAGCQLMREFSPRFVVGDWQIRPS